VLVGVHPAPMLVVGDQPAGQAIDPRFVGARTARAAPAIAQRGPAGARRAQILRCEAPPATAACARRSVGLRRDDPPLGRHCAIIRTHVPFSRITSAPPEHGADAMRTRDLEPDHVWMAAWAEGLAGRYG
jgi:hypothetical protein